MVTPTGVLERHAVRVEGGRVVAVEPAAASATPDVELLTAGFVDLQVNGHDDVDVAEASTADWDRLDRLLLAQGVTSWCPTLVTAPLDVLERRMERIVEAAARPTLGPEIVGIHLEGPFLGEAHGAHTGVPDGPIDLDWIDRLPPLVRIVTLGPERDGAIEAIRLLTGRGVVVALGHTTASFEATSAAVDAGARLFTHVFNASGPLHHRRPGALGAALTDDRVTVTLIADGIHVHPSILRMAWRAKPTGRCALVTDAIGWRTGRLADAGVVVDGGAPRLADGTLAGSCLTMPAAIRGCTEATGVALGEALAAANAVPAGVLGLDDRGVIAPGRRADLVGLGADLSVQGVWCSGELVAQPPTDDR